MIPLWMTMNSADQKDHFKYKDISTKHYKWTSRKEHLKKKKIHYIIFIIVTVVE